MIRKTFKVGSMECNCSIVMCPDSHDAVVVDPGGDIDEIKRQIAELGAKVKYILITHAHFDHVQAAGALKAATGAPICLHPKDLWLYRVMPIQYKLYGIKDKRPPRPDKLLQEGDLLEAGVVSLKVMHTPGHSPGACCFHDAKHQTLFSGDTLFQESVGNWQFPGGNFEKLMKSIERLAQLPDETIVVPGHMDETTIGAEKANSRYFDPQAVAQMRLEESQRPGKMKILGLMIAGLFRSLFRGIFRRK